MKIAERIKNSSIRFKLIGSLAAVFTIAVLTGGTVIYQTVRSTIETNIESELTNATAAILNMVRTAASTSIKNHLKTTAETNRDMVQSIYSDFQNGLISEKEAKKRSVRLLFSQTIGKTGYIYCADSNGIAIEHPVPGVAGRNFMDHEFVQIMVKKKQGYLEYDWQNPNEVKKRPKAMYMVYFEPWDWIISVSSYREEFRELIDISDFKDAILDLKFGTSGYAYITDSKGNLVVHPFTKGNYYNVQDESGEYFVQKITALKNGKLVYSWKNPQESVERKKLVIFNYIPEYDWIVASASYFDEIYWPLKTIRMIITATVLSIIVLVFLTSLWMNSQVLDPLETLMERFSIGASGNLSTRMPVASSDEIGRLSEYFNDFMEKLERYSASLQLEISQHKRTEEALRASEEKYRTILERMEEGYFELDFSGRFIFINFSMEKILEAFSDSVLDKKIDAFMDQENTEKINLLFLEIRKTGNAVTTSEFELVKSNGARCAVETSISLLFDANKSAIGYTGVLRDVTQRKKRELALKLSESKFSKAFRSSPSGMVIMTLNKAIIIDANDSFLSISGYDHSQLINVQFNTLNFFVHEKEGIELLEEGRRNHRLKKKELGFFHSNGERRTGVVSAEVIDFGQEKCILVSMEDITETRKFEKQILRAGEKERRKIAMELHDDLCPHLIGIEALTKLLVRNLEKKKMDESQNLEKIRCLMIESIEKTRQLSHGLFPINLSEHNLEPFIRDLALYVTDVFGISCRFICTFSQSFADTSTAFHLYYITYEAVYNAVKHAKTKTIDIILADTGEKIELSIKDEGIGLKKDGPSKGMGLKIMRHRAGMIGAAFKLASPDEGGTVVLIELNKDELRA